MADLKISQLTDLAAQPATDDYYAIVDTSATTTKKVSQKDVNKAVAFRAWLSTDFNTATDDFKKFDTDTEDFDYGSCWDTTNDRFTAPANGVYYFAMTGSVAALTSTDELEYWIKLNGSTYVARSRAGTSVATPKTSQGINTTLALASGDYIEFWTLTAGACSLTSGSKETWCEGFLIGYY